MLSNRIEDNCIVPAFTFAVSTKMSAMKYVNRSILSVVFFILFFFISHQLSAQTIKGKVLDVNTSEALVGATVAINGTGAVRKDIVKLDGSFVFKNVKAGTYKVTVDFIGYEMPKEYTISVSSGQVKQLSILMKETAASLIDVTVASGSDKSGDNGARRLERTAEPVMNILSSKTIQLLPDITVANALQRVSGVTIERSNSGQGRYPDHTGDGKKIH